MRKVIAIGETILDIIFKDSQPTAAVPGGSSFNSIISLGRSGVPAFFLGETGCDEVGRLITAFLRNSNVDSTYLHQRTDIQSAVSLAFLNSDGDAQYMFYKQPPPTLSNITTPPINPDDVVQFGSYYAVNPNIHPAVETFLTQSRNNGAILYYDINYRRTYRTRVKELLPTIQNNLRLTDVARGSADDFAIMFDSRDPQTIYDTHIAPYCPLFICTNGPDDITVFTPSQTVTVPVMRTKTVSTIGAGDNFNAGFIFGLMRYGFRRTDLHNADKTIWQKLLKSGIQFARQACKSMENFVNPDFGKRMATLLPRQ